VDNGSFFVELVAPEIHLVGIRSQTDCQGLVRNASVPDKRQFTFSETTMRQESLPFTRIRIDFWVPE
jgi:hypothetical protein